MIRKTFRKYKPKLQEYEFHEVIGNGAFSKVFRAFNKKLQRIVALKIIPKDSITDSAMLDHIINERNVLRLLSNKNDRILTNDIEEEAKDCPFIMKLHTYFKNEANIFFEVEYVPGCTLFS